MRPRIIAATALAVGLLALVGLVAAVLAVGGGEGGGGQPAVRIDQGLSVAALAQGGAAQRAADVVQGGGGTAQSVVAPATGGKGGDVGFGAPFVAQQQAGQTGITVQGFGSATADADSAVLQLYFGSGGGVYGKPVPMPYPQTEPPTPGETPAPPKPIEEADLQPVIDAIVAQGVARSDIEFTGGPYYDPYSSSAILTVKVANINSLDGIIKAATDAAAGLTGIFLQNTSVSYTVKDCASLEKAALQAAVDDAKARATVFAQTLAVGLGGVTGASSYSYSPYGGTACGGGGFPGPYPYAMGGMPYFQGQPSQVQVVANVSITYSIQ